MYYPKQPNYQKTNVVYKMFPVYFDRDNHVMNIEHRFDLAFNYISTAIGGALLNRFVSYLFHDTEDEVDTHDLSLSMAEKGEYNKTARKESIEDIVERGEYYEYRIL